MQVSKLVLLLHIKERYPSIILPWGQPFMSEKLQKIHYPPCNMRMIRTWLIVAGDPILCNVIHFFHVIHWLGLTRLWLICSCREIHARRHNHNCLLVKYRSKSPWWHTVAIQPICDLLNRFSGMNWTPVSIVNCCHQYQEKAEMYHLKG